MDGCCGSKFCILFQWFAAYCVIRKLSSSYDPYSHCIAGSAARVILFHLLLSITSSSRHPSSFMSLFSTFLHLNLCLPTLILPITGISIAFFTGSSSYLLFTYPKYLSLASLAFSPILHTPHIPLISSLSLLSNNEIPAIHLTILISVLSKISFSFFLNSHISPPYKSTGLMILL